MQPPDHPRPRPGTDLDGYRLLRKLGEGRRAEVFLGTAAGEPHSALKVYRHSCVPADRAVELEALTRAAHAHVVQLRDVASNSLIIERLELGSLAQLNAARSRLTIGEALTILAPLGSALDAVHVSGATHGAIAPGTILFRATGAPVLACFGRAELHETGLTPAALGAVSAVVSDRSAFARLANALLLPHDDARVAGLLDWLADQAAQGFPDAIGEALGERLFEIADAEPVRFERDDDPPTSVVPARVGRPSAAPPVSRTESSAIGRRTGLPDWIDEVVSESLDGSPVAAVRARLLPHLRGVRKPVWLAAGGVAAALVVALLVVPTNDEPAATSLPSAEPVPSQSPAVGEDAENPVVGEPLVVGDDPVAALVVLLETRQRCIRDLSILCLDEVDQAGSVAMASDVALLRSLQSDSGEQVVDAPLDPSAAELVERLGDSALIRLADTDAPSGETQPASLLLMKGEAGWRIRSYLR